MRITVSTVYGPKTVTIEYESTSQDTKVNAVIASSVMECVDRAVEVYRKARIAEKDAAEKGTDE